MALSKKLRAYLMCIYFKKPIACDKTVLALLSLYLSVLTAVKYLSEE